MEEEHDEEGGGDDQEDDDEGDDDDEDDVEDDDEVRNDFFTLFFAEFVVRGKKRNSNFQVFSKIDLQIRVRLLSFACRVPTWTQTRTTFLWPTLKTCFERARMTTS